jgi:lipopolysaccharide export system permease protein
MVAFISAYLAPKGLRELRDWATQVRADLVTNIVQPGRFTTIESGLTFHIRERRPNGLLLGIFVDDGRDPKERVTILAEQGEILKNDKGTFLILQNGSLQRHEAEQRDPTMVVFDRYAFDLSKFSGSGPQSVKYSVRERYFWELLSSNVSDTTFVDSPAAQIRAELHDRIIAPFYPFAFVIIAFAYLGAPRTTRQSRSMSLLGAIAGVAAVRLIGFSSTVLGVHTPFALLFQYLAVFGAIGVGTFAISRGIIIEPPASVTNIVNAVVERFTRRSMAT